MQEVVLNTVMWITICYAVYVVVMFVLMMLVAVSYESHVDTYREGPADWSEITRTTLLSIITLPFNIMVWVAQTLTAKCSNHA